MGRIPRLKLRRPRATTRPSPRSVALLVLLVCVCAASASAMTVAHTDSGESTGCAFITAPAATPAFCDTFDQPSESATRSGALDGTLWGVSRATSLNNPPQGMLYQWAGVSRDTCGTAESVAPEQDVAICDGQAVEAVNDNGGETDLAMYPRQPFDFAGRTGTVEFDVSDNTQGPHAAWPAFVISDQPVPAPYSLAAGLADHARDSVGFTLADSCGQYGCGGNDNPPGAGATGFSCVGVDTIFITVDYQLTQESVNQDGCVLPSTTVGSNNHFEVQVNAQGIKIYGSDPGDPGSTRLIADSSFTMPLSRGLVWLEDVHYNGDKFNTQQSDTFSWDNVAFDGPVLPRDLGFDLLDGTTPGRSPAENGQPTQNLGFDVPGGGDLSLTVPGVTDISAASGALLTFNYWAETAQTITYSVNGNPPLQFPWPFGNTAAYVSETAAVPVPLSELVPGDNTVELMTSDPSGVAVANLDLILQGAGGIPGASTTGTSTTATPTTTDTGTSTVTSSSVPGPAGGSTSGGSTTGGAGTTATTAAETTPTPSGTKPTAKTKVACARARALSFLVGHWHLHQITSLTVRRRGTRANPSFVVTIIGRNSHGRRVSLRRVFHGCVRVKR